ncbi:MAG: HEPN domain-containing protein [Bacteroidales bacterium]|nr:HEPN domain-containing protein [Bacteroidales bacterium]
MKETTKDWFTAAEDDLLSAKKLISEERLTNIVAFHCQQCIEKSLKGIIEEKNKPSAKSHDLLRLRDIAGIVLSDQETILLETINEVYIDARYPTDLGLMPNGKPTTEEAETFISFTENLNNKLIQLVQ